MRSAFVNVIFLRLSLMTLILHLDTKMSDAVLNFRSEIPWRNASDAKRVCISFDYHVTELAISRDFERGIVWKEGWWGEKLC